jgi:hypothetical protein
MAEIGRCHTRSIGLEYGGLTDAPDRRSEGNARRCIDTIFQLYASHVLDDAEEAAVGQVRSKLRS